MTLLDRAEQLTGAAGGAVIPSGDATELVSDLGGDIELVLRGLVPLAARRAKPWVSGFQVGAVGQADSGAIYLGANYEFERSPLDQTVHAEQAVVVNAMIHGETGLRRLAVSAAPCGHCRQFLNELGSAGRLDILVMSEPTTEFSAFLPAAFGPRNLGVTRSLLIAPPNDLQCETASVAAETALAAARRAYSPYTSSPAGVGLVTRDGRRFLGPYIENAAFNPSLPPIQAALVAAFLGGADGADVVEAALVQLTRSRIDHAPSARLILERVAPDVSLEVCIIP